MNIFLSNECLFLIHSFIISFFTLCALWIGKEALVAIIVIHCALANLFVTKQISLFSLSATGTDAFIIGSMIGLNLLQEYWGSQIAAKTILINFFILLYFIASSIMHRAYHSNEFDTTSDAFRTILSPLPWIIVVSMVVFLLVQLVDYKLFQTLRIFSGNRLFVIRNFGSFAFSQLLDTLLFSFFGLGGIVHNVWHVALISYLIKLLSMFIISPLLFLFLICFKRFSNRNIDKNS